MRLWGVSGPGPGVGPPRTSRGVARPPDSGGRTMRHGLGRGGGEFSVPQGLARPVRAGDCKTCAARRPKRQVEITAIPQLLEQIELAGTLIMIDAMGCQKEVVERVVTGGGDCVIAVKDNQPKFLAAIRASFLDQLERDLEDLRY